MSKKNIFMALLVVGLSAVYLIYFTDLFRPQQLQISARPRVERSRRGSVEVVSVSFSFEQQRVIKELKVVAVADAETNQYPQALWNLIADTNSVPLKGLTYGETPKGMKSKVPKVRAAPLQPQTKYRLLVDAEGIQGQVDFEIPRTRAR